MSIGLRRGDKDIFDASAWISQSEAARLRGVSREAIYNLVKKNRFTTFKIGDKTLINRADVENYQSQPSGRKSKKRHNEATSTQLPGPSSSISQQRGESVSSNNSQSANRLNNSTKLHQQSVKLEDWISQAEAARIRGVSQQAIVNLIRRGRLTTVNMAGRTVVLRSEVENFIAKLKGGRPSKQVANRKSANDIHSKK